MKTQKYSGKDLRIIGSIGYYTSPIPIIYPFIEFPSKPLEIFPDPNPYIPEPWKPKPTPLKPQPDPWHPDIFPPYPPFRGPYI
jgi:hypothetical protein